MKRTLALLALALLIGGGLSAQESGSGMKGIHFSFGYAHQGYNYTFKSLNNETYSQNLHGFYFNVQKHFSLSDELGLNVGIGERVHLSKENSFGGNSGDNYWNTQVLFDLPLLVDYTFRPGGGWGISPFAGCMLSLGLLGYTINNDEESGHIYSWYDDLDRRRADLSLLLGLNVSYGRVGIDGGYSLGLLDLQPGDGTTLRSHAFFVGMSVNL